MSVFLSTRPVRLDLGAVIHDHVDFVGIRDDVILVTTTPAASMMKPEPSELVLRGGCISRFLSLPFGPPPLRFLKKVVEELLYGEPGCNCGIASLRAALGPTLCEGEILTTESITFSAMRRMPSARARWPVPTQQAGGTERDAIPIRRRRRLKAGLAPVMSAGLQKVGIRVHSGAERARGASICA